MSDENTIYRQAAIDAINSHFGFNTEEEYGIAVQEVINGLPSAQPEIMRCKDCKHKPSGSGVNHDISFPDDVCPCQCEDYWYSWMPEDDWFCGSWERREE